MGFAKIAPASNIHDYKDFKVGEFFRYKEDIWVKTSDMIAINISRSNDKNYKNASFGERYQCEDIQVKLKIL